MDVAVAVWCEASRGGGGDGVSARRRFIVVRADDGVAAEERQAADTADRELLRRIQQDDTRALDQLLRAHAAGLTRYATLFVGRTEIAQDVVQDVFIKLWDIRHDLVLTGNVGGYLLRMTRNRAQNVARHERSIARIANAVAADASLVRVQVHHAESQLQTEELAHAIQRAVAALPPRVREIFLMRRQSGLPAAAVADALGISVGAVHVQLSRALRRIAEEIARYLE